MLLSFVMHNLCHSCDALCPVTRCILPVFVYTLCPFLVNLPLVIYQCPTRINSAGFTVGSLHTAPVSVTRVLVSLLAEVVTVQISRCAGVSPTLV